MFTTLCRRTTFFETYHRGHDLYVECWLGHSISLLTSRWMSARQLCNNCPPSLECLYNWCSLCRDNSSFSSRMDEFKCLTLRWWCVVTCLVSSRVERPFESSWWLSGTRLCLWRVALNGGPIIALSHSKAASSNHHVAYVSHHITPHYLISTVRWYFRFPSKNSWPLDRHYSIPPLDHLGLHPMIRGQRPRVY